MQSSMMDRQPGCAPPARGVAAVIVAGCMWGAIGPFVRHLDALGYSSLDVVFARMSLAFVILAAALCLTGRGCLFRVKSKDLWALALTGVSSAILLNLFYTTSIVMNSLAFASVLLITAPAFVVLISAVIFHEKITARKLWALLVVFTGCVLTSGIFGQGFGGATLSFSGVGVGLLASIGWALYSVMTRVSMNHGYGTMTINVYTFGIGAAVAAPFVHFGPVVSSVADKPLEMSVFLLAHTLVASLLPYMLFNYGMRFMETGTAAILSSVDPVFAAILGIVFYRETPDVPVVIGIVVVLAGIAVLNTDSR